MKPNRSEKGDQAAEGAKGPERWTLGDIRSDLHVIHFAPGDDRVPAGEKGAGQTVSEIIDFAYENLPNNSMIVVGNHSLGYDTLRGMEHYYQGEFPTTAEHIQFLADQKDQIKDSQRRALEKYPDKNKLEVLFGVEADIYLDEEGRPYLNPPTEVLGNSDISPDIVIASFHKFEAQIPANSDRAEKLTEGFMYAIESGVVHKFGHPLQQLTRVRENYPESFQQIIEAARERGVVFEVNTGPKMVGLLEQEEYQATLQALIQNGNLIDMGVDFHNFAMYKSSGLIAEGRAERLTDEDKKVIEQYDRHQKFKASEGELWKSVLDAQAIDIDQEVILYGTRYKLRDILWRIYKNRVPKPAEESPLKAFGNQVSEVVSQINIGQADEEIRKKITYLLVKLHTEFEKGADIPEEGSREAVFRKTGFTLGDLRRMYGPVRILRNDLNLPRSQFINTWPLEDQKAHFKSLKERFSAQ